ncbi:MAG: outer membrane protein assembly factor BamD [Burkholderiaceae bacterium]
MNGLIKRFTAASVVALLALALTGCGLFGDKRPDPKTATPEQIYKEAKEEMSSGNWNTAVQILNRLEGRDPFGIWGQQAQLELIYAYWKDSDPTQALAAADRFIKLHPNHQAMDYVLYLKGLINFNDNRGFFARLGGQDLTERDPRAARDSFDSFKELVTRFPESRYAKDATDRMNYLVNALAQYEVHVARYYLRRGAPLAAVNRAQFAVRTYQTAPATEEALAIMVVAYEDLGLQDLRADAQRVLDKNFPKSTLISSVKEGARPPWYKLW